MTNITKLPDGHYFVFGSNEAGRHGKGATLREEDDSITWQELLEICEDYSSARWSDANNNTRFGCDCGCGGDLYTAEEWRDMIERADDAEKKFAELCEKLGIDFDIYGGNGS